MKTVADIRQRADEALRMSRSLAASPNQTVSAGSRLWSMDLALKSYTVLRACEGLLEPGEVEKHPSLLVDCCDIVGWPTSSVGPVVQRQHSHKAAAMLQFLTGGVGDIRNSERRQLAQRLVLYTNPGSWARDLDGIAHSVRALQKSLRRAMRDLTDANHVTAARRRGLITAEQIAELSLWAAGILAEAERTMGPRKRTASEEIREWAGDTVTALRRSEARILSWVLSGERGRQRPYDAVDELRHQRSLMSRTRLPCDELYLEDGITVTCRTDGSSCTYPGSALDPGNRSLHSQCLELLDLTIAAASSLLCAGHHADTGEVTNFRSSCDLCVDWLRRAAKTSNWPGERSRRMWD